MWADNYFINSNYTLLLGQKVRNIISSRKRKLWRKKRSHNQFDSFFFLYLKTGNVTINVFIFLYLKVHENSSMLNLLTKILICTLFIHFVVSYFFLP